MSDDKKSKKIEEELKKQQKFSMASAIGRSGGGGMLKGASPIPKQDQATNQIKDFVREQCSDPSGAIKSILNRRVKSSTTLIEKHLDNPKAALAELLQSILNKDTVLYEFVRQVDVRWGEMYQERPMFQQPGDSAHPDDEYTHESVKADLTSLLQTVQNSL